MDYIDNKAMFEAFIKHREKVAKARKEGKQDPILPNYIGKCFILIAENLARKPSYAGYSYIDEMKDDAIENCVVAANNFDPAKSSNPFAYFTQITTWAFWRRIEKEKRSNYVKYKLYQRMDISGELYAGDKEFRSIGNAIDEVANEVVSNFEEMKLKRDNKAKESKKNKKGVEKLFKDSDE